MGSTLQHWQPVTVHVPPARPCEAALCRQPAAGHVMWLTRDWSTLHTAEACAGHLQVLRELYRCPIFPLDHLPPADVLMPAVNAEIQRRRPPVVNVFTMNITTTTGTMSGWVFR